MVFEKYMVFENININDIIKSIFLMLLAISGGYVAQTLGCKTQNLLTNNLYVKHIVIIMLIYFTSNVFGETKILLSLITI